jgi:hypothetical protein
VDDDFAHGAAIASAAPPEKEIAPRSGFHCLASAIARSELARLWNFERPLVK